MNMRSDHVWITYDHVVPKGDALSYIPCNKLTKKRLVVVLLNDARWVTIE